MMMPAIPQIHAIQLIIALSDAGIQYILTNESRTNETIRSDAAMNIGFSAFITQVCASFAPLQCTAVEKSLVRGAGIEPATSSTSKTRSTK